VTGVTGLDVRKSNNTCLKRQGCFPSSFHYFNLNWTFSTGEEYRDCNFN